MSELEDLINRTHAAGLKVVMDFVPNHVARNYRSDRPFDLGVGDDPSVHWKPENDFYYYPGETLCLPGGSGRWQELPARASGNAFTSSPSRNDWFDTVRLNYCPFHTPTWDKMYDIVRFWASKGVDGFRCDMVEMVPKEFFQWLIAKVKRAFPDLRFIAEAYDRNNYRTLVRETGFDWLYDKSGLYDRLRAVTTGSAGTGELTRNWQELGPLQPAMLHFLENHDEQRVASRFFAGAPEKAYPALTVSALFTDAPFMLYFGQEIGEPGGAEDGRTSIFDRIAVPSLARLYDEIHGVQDALLPAERCVLAHYRDVLQCWHITAMSCSKRTPFSACRTTTSAGATRNGPDSIRTVTLPSCAGSVSISVRSTAHRQECRTFTSLRTVPAWHIRAGGPPATSDGRPAAAPPCRPRRHPRLLRYPVLASAGR